MIRVLTADESAAADAATIDAGVPSRALMQRAGAAAAAEIARRHADRLHRGVAIHAGPGNNGGDAWVVARALAAAGVAVRVAATGPSTTGDARAERELAEPLLDGGAPTGAEQLVVDGLLGTGARGAPRGAVADAVRAIATARAGGAIVVALDVPSGVDATTGAQNGAVAADLTLAFGSAKRGLLLAREQCGTICVLEIGLLPHAAPDAPALVDAPWVAAHLSPIAADAHKGVRRKLVVVGGQRGMAGAAVLAARAALASGIGMVRLLVDPAGVPVVQGAVPQALAGEWPRDDGGADEEIGEWADVVLVGPGLGHDEAARALVERVLRRWRGPVVLDADALNVFAGDLDTLRELLGDRDALLTPHPGEFARLGGHELSDVLQQRFDIGADVAGRSGATVLLKGVPTVVTSPDGPRLVSAAGTAALAAAGSGDLLGGIAATLVAQRAHAMTVAGAAAAAAWAHGRAAEIAGAGHHVRGITLTHVLRALPCVWRSVSSADEARAAGPCLPVLAELPAPPGARAVR